MPPPLPSQYPPPPMCLHLRNTCHQIASTPVRLMSAVYRHGIIRGETSSSPISLDDYHTMSPSLDTSMEWTGDDSELVRVSSPTSSHDEASPPNGSTGKTQQSRTMALLLESRRMLFTQIQREGLSRLLPVISVRHIQVGFQDGRLSSCVTQVKDEIARKLPCRRCKCR